MGKKADRREVRRLQALVNEANPTLELLPEEVLILASAIEHQNNFWVKGFDGERGCLSGAQSDQLKEKINRLAAHLRKIFKEKVAQPAVTNAPAATGVSIASETRNSAFGASEHDGVCSHGRKWVDGCEMCALIAEVQV